MEKEIELKFIEQALQKHGAILKSALIKEINEKKLISENGSKHLKDSLSYTVTRTGINGYQFCLYFPDYGRFLEINYHKRKPRVSEMAFGRNSQSGSASGLARVSATRKTKGAFKKKRKKDTRWYSKQAYGSLNTLIGHLMYGLTDTVQEALKNELTQPI